MKFLVDAQLPKRLAERLTGAGHDVLHTLDLLSGNRTTDQAICAIADEQDRVVVSKDSDFRDSHLLHGTPKRFLEVATDNIRNAELLDLVDKNLSVIVAAFADCDHIELSNIELIIHPRHRDT